MKKIAILQSNYIPWKGYFDLIGSVDEFVIFDEMQYTRRDWRNRNLIKTADGLKWLTVPVKAKGKFNQKISETLIDGNDWSETHWKTIIHNYKKAKHFEEVSYFLKPIFIDENFNYLSELNLRLIQKICEYLNITTKISHSHCYSIVSGKTERLVDICVQAKADVYISGPSAQNYIDKTVFENKNIKLEWFNYANYPEYFQLWGDFAHGVSIIDLLFNAGDKSNNFLKWLQK
jgi:hypothetical protein